MSSAAIDVVGIGNAIVDVIAHADEAFIAAQGFAKGSMNLIDAPRAQSLYDAMGPAIESSGGSAGNTMAGIASLGGRGAYIGKVRDDELGAVFRHDLRAIGVKFETPAATSGPATARCLIMVTPDGQRTMGTYLGACVELGPDEIEEALIASAQVTYLEGYLFDPPQAQAAFRELVRGEVDILFANEAEICSLYETDDFAAAAKAVRGHVAIAALTRSERGSVVLADGEEHAVAAAPVARVVDTTGAGDLYAAGFLFGLTRGLALPTCGSIGSLCAAEIISHVGARPEVALKGLVEAARLV